MYSKGAKNVGYSRASNNNAAVGLLYMYEVKERVTRPGVMNKRKGVKRMEEKGQREY